LNRFALWRLYSTERSNQENVVSTAPAAGTSTASSPLFSRLHLLASLHFLPWLSSDDSSMRLLGWWYICIGLAFVALAARAFVGGCVGRVAQAAGGEYLDGQI